MKKHPQLAVQGHRPKRVCLFGTSANPPTGAGGHAGVIQALVDLRKFDEIRILPVYRHTFVSKRHQLLGFDHRFKMCELLVKGLSITENKDDTTKVVVSRAEKDSFARMINVSRAVTDEEKAVLRVGTADLLEMLMEDEERTQTRDKSISNTKLFKTEFSFCLGADTFIDLTDFKWKRSKDVLKLLGGRLVVVNRMQQQDDDTETVICTDISSDAIHQQQKQKDLLRGRIDKINATPLGDENIMLLYVPSLGDVSSSQVRKADNKELVQQMLSPEVLDYVIANNLYGFGEKKKEVEEEEGSIIV